MKTLSLMPWLVALLAGLAAMPATNVFKICAWNAGTMAVDPWRVKTASAMRGVAHGIRTWLASLFTRRVVFACLAVLLAILVSQLSAGHEGFLLAIVPVATAGAQTQANLQARRAELLREADAFRPSGTFVDDAARAAFDAKMTEVEAIDAQLRTAPSPVADAAAIAQARDAAVSEERARVSGIQGAVQLAKLERSVADDMVSRGITLEAARTEIFAKLAAVSDATRENPHRLELGEGERDKWLRGAGNWLMHRAGVAGLVAQYEKASADAMAPGEFRGLSLLDLARESLVRQGVNVRGLDRMEIAGRAMSYRSGGWSYQTTSDFATLLENVLHKVLRAAYGVVPDTWTKFCATATAVDFRTHNWYRTGALTVLDSPTDSGEFQNKQIPDGEKATFTVGTKGNIIAISRQTIVNDDLGFVVRLTQALGRAGKLTIEKMVYALLAQNAGLGPTMSDTLTLFHATHGNLTTGAALSAAALDADRVAMASQLDPNGQDYIDVRPAVLLIGIGLGGQARIINQSQYDPDTLANKSQMKPNIVAGLFRDIVDTPRVTSISATRRYLFADPSLAPVIVVSFLEGQTEPILETQDGWRTDGVEMKARLDVGVDVVDYRGAVTNAGV